MKSPYDILIRPVITEKATAAGAHERPQYAFEVHIDANKVEVREAVERVFDVHVDSVNVIRVKGKRKRLRTVRKGRRPERKKAFVTLVAGETINLLQ